MKNWIKIDRDENGLAAEECLSRIEHFYMNGIPVMLGVLDDGVRDYCIIAPDHSDIVRRCEDIRKRAIYTYYMPIPRVPSCEDAAVPGEAVDLGLPSGLKWASCNVGATSPEELGGYYAWGEIEEKDDYSWATYKWCNGTSDTMTKYCTDSSYGTVDNKTVLDPEDDVATVKWGGNWRMPTLEEQQELLDNCTWKWTTLNGINGYQVTGPNGNSIFLPAAGSRYGTNVNLQGSYGCFWSASLFSGSSSYAYYLYFNSGYYDWNYSHRYDGHSVRPVSE